MPPLADGHSLNTGVPANASEIRGDPSPSRVDRTTGRTNSSLNANKNLNQEQIWNEEQTSPSGLFPEY